MSSGLNLSAPNGEATSSSVSQANTPADTASIATGGQLVTTGARSAPVLQQLPEVEI